MIGKIVAYHFETKISKRLNQLMFQYKFIEYGLLVAQKYFFKLKT